MTNNPLKQYFRRPSIWIKLPSGGKFYDISTLDMPPGGDLPVYPMSAIDEITSKTPDALFNGHAVAEIIHSCVPNIKNAWNINNIDLDSIIMAIRIASSGEELDIDTVCPECKNESKFALNLIELLANQKNIDYNEPLLIRDLEVHFRPLTYHEKNETSLKQYEIQKMMVMIDDIEDQEEKKKYTSEILQKLNTIMNGVITSTIHGIKTPETMVTDKEFIKEFLDNCDKQTNKSIRDHSTKLNEQNKIKPLEIKCINCGHQYSQQLILNYTDFFV